MHLPTDILSTEGRVLILKWETRVETSLALLLRILWLEAFSEVGSFSELELV